MTYVVIREVKKRSFKLNTTSIIITVNALIIIGMLCFSVYSIEVVSNEKKQFQKQFQEAFKKNSEILKKLKIIEKAFQLKTTENYALKNEIKKLTESLKNIKTLENVQTKKESQYLLNAQNVFLDTCFCMELTEEIYEKFKTYPETNFIVLECVKDELKKLLQHHSFQKAKSAQSGLAFLKKGLNEGLFKLAVGADGAYTDDIIVNTITQINDEKVSLLTYDRELLDRVNKILSYTTIIAVNKI